MEVARRIEPSTELGYRALSEDNLVGTSPIVDKQWAAGISRSTRLSKSRFTGRTRTKASSLRRAPDQLRRDQGVRTGVEYYSSLGSVSHLSRWNESNTNHARGGFESFPRMGIQFWGRRRPHPQHG